MHAYYAADLDRLFREYKRSLYISPKKRLLITQSAFANGALHEPDPGLLTRVGIGRERERGGGGMFCLDKSLVPGLADWLQGQCDRALSMHSEAWFSFHAAFRLWWWHSVTRGFGNPGKKRHIIVPAADKSHQCLITISGPLVRRKGSDMLNSPTQVTFPVQSTSLVTNKIIYVARIGV